MGHYWSEMRGDTMKLLRCNGCGAAGVVDAERHGGLHATDRQCVQHLRKRIEALERHIVRLTQKEEK